MADSASIANRPIIIGDKIATLTAGGEVEVTSKDGSKVSMDVEQFKAYLIKNAKVLNATNPIGDTVTFRGNASEEIAETEAEPKKSGLSTLSKLILTAGVVGVGIWQRKNISKLCKNIFEKFKGTGKEAGEKIASELPMLYTGTEHA